MTTNKYRSEPERTIDSRGPTYSPWRVSTGDQVILFIINVTNTVLLNSLNLALRRSGTLTLSTK